MKILITMKLSNRSLYNHIYPFTLLKEVDKIFIVRDIPGPYIEKVTYICPPKSCIKFSPLIFIIKLYLIFYTIIKEQPTFVHSYLLFPHGLLAIITGKIFGKNVGVTLIAGPVELFDFGGSPEGFPYSKPLPPTSLKGKIIFKFLKKCDVIGVTGSFTKIFLISCGIDKEKIFIIPHIVDDNFKPRSDIKKDIDVVYIGRLARVKNVKTLIKAIHYIQNEIPSIRCVIVGDGEEKKSLEDLVDSLKLQKNIEFVGFQKNAWDWFNRSKISVLLSEREGFPYSIIESLSCGIPVVTSNCGDVNDIIQDCYNGQIVNDNDDSKKFGDEIIKIINNNKLLDAYSKNSLKTIENNNLANLLPVLQKMLKSIGEC